MELIEHTSEWALGDALQGKIMLFSGILAVTAMFFIFKGDNGVLKGMMIPLGLLALIALGYGGFLTFGRPAHIEKVRVMYQEDPAATVAAELKKAETDHRNYTVIKYVWPVLMAISALLLLVFKSEYQQGLLMGLLILFIYGMILDTFLHHKLSPYLEVLRSLSLGSGAS